MNLICRCMQCGEIKYRIESGILNVPMPDGSEKRCECPSKLVSTHHTGKLDTLGCCRVFFSDSGSDSPFVTLHRDMVPEPWASYHLAPGQLLSLMAWGEQNRTQLEQLAKEQEV